MLDGILLNHSNGRSFSAFLYCWLGANVSSFGQRKGKSVSKSAGRTMKRGGRVEAGRKERRQHAYCRGRNRAGFML